MSTNDTGLVLLACLLAVATLIALVAGMVGTVTWEDESALRAVALAAGEAPDWPPVIW
jgi:hypothetical protein